MDEIYERLNPRIPIEYVLFSFLVLSIVIVLGMLMMKWGRVKKFLLGSLLSEYYFLVLCSTVICRGCGSERRKELVPFWNYADIWNRVDYPTDLIEVLLNIALFVPIGLLLGGMGMKLKKAFLSGVVLSCVIEGSQFAFRRGLCETDDVIHNTLGCISVQVQPRSCEQDKDKSSFFLPFYIKFRISFFYTMIPLDFQ